MTEREKSILELEMTMVENQLPGMGQRLLEIAEEKLLHGMTVEEVIEYLKPYYNGPQFN